jgi:hypothetical protein
MDGAAAVAVEAADAALAWVGVAAIESAAPLDMGNIAQGLAAYRQPAALLRKTD